MRRRDFLVESGVAFGSLVSAEANEAVHEVQQVDSKCRMEQPYKQPGRSQQMRTSSGGNVLDPTYIDERYDCRSISFESPTGERGAGGRLGGGRKGRPSHVLERGEKLVLADIAGPGIVRHIWAVVSLVPPRIARSIRFEVFYDTLPQPSISVPFLDFFGLPHGLFAEYYSTLTSVHEGRGLNSYMPMPFTQRIRIEIKNESDRLFELFYQIDYTLLCASTANRSYLHATFRRDNPTALRRDFTITEGFKGPGRFLGCVIGVRPLDTDSWYGEGEVKIYRDGDEALPTYCGTGLEDYVGSANGLGRHYGHYSGAPIAADEYVGFYRWHLPDPVMFSSDLRVTIQQIGSAKVFKSGEELLFRSYKETHVPAGTGWCGSFDNYLDLGSLVERVDDYCATAFVYCRHPQAASRYSSEEAARDLPVIKTDSAVQLTDASYNSFENILAHQRNVELK